MMPETNSRRGFLKGLAAVFGGVGAMTLMAAPAQAGRSHWRGGYGGYGGYGYGPVYRRSSGRRFYGGGYNSFYNGGYYGGGYYRGGPGFYGGGYNYASPYVVPAPVVPIQPYYYNGYYGPMMKRDAVRAIDALSLLEA